LSLEFCYEAGGCGYGIYRQLTKLGHACAVVATSLIPRKPGERIKTDRRDSQKLAILHRSGDLTPVWVPDEAHEAMRDLTRARIDASMQLMRARQQCLAFLLRYGRTYETGKHWTQRHRSWLAGQTFDQAAHQIVFQDYVEAVWSAQDRRDQLIARIAAMSAAWSMGPIVEALRSLRGLDFISAVTLTAAIGDLGSFRRRASSWRIWGSYLLSSPAVNGFGAVGSPRLAIAKPAHADRGGVELSLSGASREGEGRNYRRQPKPIREIAWKAQLRLCRRFRALSASGKRPTVVVAAIARELPALCGLSARR